MLSTTGLRPAEEARLQSAQSHGVLSTAFSSASLRPARRCSGESARARSGLGGAPARVLAALGAAPGELCSSECAALKGAGCQPVIGRPSPAPSGTPGPPYTSPPPPPHPPRQGSPPHAPSGAFGPPPRGETEEAIEDHHIRTRATRRRYGHAPRGTSRPPPPGSC